MKPIMWRQAGIRDAAILAHLGRQTFIETFGHLYSPENLAAFLQYHSVENWQRELVDTEFSVLLGEAEGEAAAYAKIGPPSLQSEVKDPAFEMKGPAIELRQFYLLRPWHGSGAAETMMAWVMEQARGRGAAEILLSVFIDNPRARRFYERHGFEYVGKFHFMVGDHADEDLIMRRRLT